MTTRFQTSECVDCHKALSVKRKLQRCRVCRIRCEESPREQPLCVGYLYSHRKCWNTQLQREIIGRWYWNQKNFVWGDYYEDNYSSRKPLRSRDNIQKLLSELRKGDMLVAARLGALCKDPDDVTDGIPAFLDQGIRVYLVADNLELTTRDIRLIRVLQQSWLVTDVQAAKLSPLQKYTEEPPSLKELKYMKYCYRQSVVYRSTSEQIAVKAQKKFKEHPRLGGAITCNRVIHDIHIYQSILADIWMGVELPPWVKRSQKSKVLTETQRQLAVDRSTELHNFVKTL